MKSFSSAHLTSRLVKLLQRKVLIVAQPVRRRFTLTFAQDLFNI